MTQRDVYCKAIPVLN